MPDHAHPVDRMQQPFTPPGISAFRPTGPELWELAHLALPVVVVQVGLVLQGVVDGVMVGRISAADLAAVALGNLYFFTVSVFGMGTLFALDPLVAQAFGAGDEKGVRLAVQRGAVLAVGLAVGASILMAVSGPVLKVLQQPPDVVPIATRYIWALIPGMLPFYGFVVCRQSLQAVGKVAPIVVTIVLANLLNAFANWILIFGNLGFPALGAVGSGWATAASRWFMFIGVLILGSKVLWPHFRSFTRDAFDGTALRALSRIGAPIGSQMFLEFGAFGAIGVMMGWLGTVPLAGHQIALSLSSLTFMVPVGISQAAAVLVGRSVGEGRGDLGRRFAGGSLLLGTSVMVLSAAVFLGFPEALARIYTDELDVIVVAAMLIPVAGVFQVFDGIQVAAAGALRGLADTRAPLIITVLGFWLLGMPVSLYLGFRTPYGPVGLWWGLAAGLGVVAFLLVIRVWVRFRRRISRLSVEGFGRSQDGDVT